MKNTSVDFHASVREPVGTLPFCQANVRELGLGDLQRREAGWPALQLSDTGSGASTRAESGVFSRPCRHPGHSHVNHREQVHF